MLWVVLVRAAAAAALVLAYLGLPRALGWPRRVGGGSRWPVWRWRGFALEAARGGEAPLVLAGGLGFMRAGAPGGCGGGARRGVRAAAGGGMAVLALAGAVAWQHRARGRCSPRCAAGARGVVRPEWLAPATCCRSGAPRADPEPRPARARGRPRARVSVGGGGLLLVPLGPAPRWRCAIRARRALRWPAARDRAGGGDGVGRLQRRAALRFTGRGAARRGGAAGLARGRPRGDD